MSPVSGPVLWSSAVMSAPAAVMVFQGTMTLTDGSVVDFASCHTCEHKSWTQAGSGLDVATVLKKATKHKVVQRTV